MKLAGLLDLQTVVDLRTSNECLGIGNTLGYELAARGEYPVPVLRIGGRYRVPTCHLVEILGASGVLDAIRENP